MPLFRKKPVIIEAYQTPVAIDIDTLEGVMHADAGDMIITGVLGEKYPCKPDIFAMTYEEVETISDRVFPENDTIAMPGRFTT